MYHVEKINIKPKHPLFEFCDTATNAAKNMYNVARFKKNRQKQNENSVRRTAESPQ